MVSPRVFKNDTELQLVSTRYNPYFTMTPVLNFVLIFFVQLATAQFPEDVNRVTEAPSRRQSNPEPAILGKLGNFFLDFDEAFGRYYAPKIDAEDAAKEQLYGKTQASRADYFDRIRENYRDLQKRVGSALGNNVDLSILSDFLGVNVRNKDDGQLVDVSLPFLPMKLRVNSNSVKSDARTKSSTTQDEDFIPITTESSRTAFVSNLELGNVKVEVGSRSSDESPRVLVDINQPSEQARSSRQRVKTAPREVDYAQRDTEDFSSRKVEEFEPTESFQAVDSTISGRILGDVLYSESTFDKIMKRVIKDSMWLLDSDLSPSKAFQRLNRFTQQVLQPQGKSEDHDRTSKTSDGKKQSFADEKTEHRLSSTEGTPFKINKSPKPLHYEVDNKPNTIQLDIVPQSDFEIPRRNEQNILLAFTLEGVPLKLKIPANVQEPLLFLHETLSAADVSLNIPINSYDDLEAAGKEILQLGAEPSKIQIDLIKELVKSSATELP
ncbi:hypothetical protein JTE90_003560 [Oedothorax gibbosus]|uniref:Uncharacterized protein n=1 Tax=Oedothorax gibbosus TaxID=931172 RepID=A0AAV6VK66_9ARAC|nr:hypothetical protein JTE90_003560 [Oedothorax gibbosus]